MRVLLLSLALMAASWPGWVVGQTPASGARASDAPRSLSLPSDTPLRMLSTADESRGWQGVGRLNIGSRGFCTAALVAPDEILTAAHCLFSRASGERIDLSQFEFLADWRMGRAAAYRGVVRAALLPDFRYSRRETLARIGHDVALLQLSRPIQLASIPPFPVADTIAPGDAVGVVSYARARAEAPALQQMCHVLAQQDAVLVLNCNVDFGSSGAPVFALGPDGARIVSIISAKAEVRGQQVALGVDLNNALPRLRTELQKLQHGQFLHAPHGSAPLGQVPRMLGGGAKFVRP